MDKNLKSVQDKKMDRAAAALEKNGYTVIKVDTKEDVIKAIEGYVKEGDVVGIGGSMTLFETGVINWLHENGCTLLDRYEKGLTGPQIGEIFRQSLLSDVYLTSTNAVTEDGRLVNVDGNGNRVAAMLFGPKSVIVIAGHNKIVEDVESAVYRIETVAAPANTARLSCKTPCAETGRCMDCASEERICNITTIIRKRPQLTDFHVIIVDEDLGY